MADDPTLKPQDRAQEVSGEWEHDNQQWWNEYMASADNEIVFASDHSIEQTQAPKDVGPLPSLADLQAELNASYELDPLAIKQFNRDGYVKLKQVLSPGALALLRQEMEMTLLADLGENPKLDFRSGEMMWLTNDIFRQFVLSPRIAKIAAALMGVQSVRLYHDNALAKEPGCGRTPWHFDKEHFPIASNNVCTAWIPLQAIPGNMGPLAFAVGMETYRLVESVQSSRFDMSYDRTVSNIFAEQGVDVDNGPFGLGEISFHHSQSFHTAGPNNTTESRMVLATTYFEEGACVIPAPTMISGDWRKFMPDVGAGEPIQSRYNPVCFPRER
ncbi:phytanoyl-CoA dioxygenase family protein [Congregibacter sp.]|jgi:ectoine hydroxylase-related dioxygenase (phytanoyl-CoA dioxygenase family)|uniref:phytanoyl-CoA dioxygenase family protein n=1 Tax=Congregibacter sp. TaxID=2744308 RepID=UPI0039E47F3C